MSIEKGSTNFESAHDCEAVSLASTDYTPKDQNGTPVIGQGLSFSAMTALVLVTEAGNTVTFNSGELLAGIIHPIKFRSITKSGTTVTNLKAYT